MSERLKAPQTPTPALARLLARLRALWTARLDRLGTHLSETPDKKNRKE
jgi:hypothetical protein